MKSRSNRLTVPQLDKATPPTPHFFSFFFFFFEEKKKIVYIVNVSVLFPCSHSLFSILSSQWLVGGCAVGWLVGRPLLPPPPYCLSTPPKETLKTKSCTSRHPRPDTDSSSSFHARPSPFLFYCMKPPQGGSIEAWQRLNFLFFLSCLLTVLMEFNFTAPAYSSPLL